MKLGKFLSLLFEIVANGILHTFLFLNYVKTLDNEVRVSYVGLLKFS